MNTTALVLLALLAISAAAPASAQYADAKALHQAATGARFQGGRASFRLLPDAVVRSTSAMAQEASVQRAESTARAGDDVIAARIGPYAVVLNGSGRTASASDAGTARISGMRVAINERSGQPVLLTGRLKLFGTTPDVAQALARRSAGSVVYASDIDGSAMLDYGSADAALRAWQQLRAAPGTREVAMDMIQGVNQTL
ncbi:hypothetical protein KAF26_07105 [Xanthomonas translucens pv. secalis]|uniref:hypothetical protein n=1 Tax=Xanthomonas campestris pv. translucens TaxID=343 RepID=UPI00071E85CD|nr:hypothetical protein [Xanthomonas translucens]QSQ51283.1 hypothetical protein ISN36_10675 [Xanthomonas translucens pv. undulosa]QSQ59800.1 hypothetical protein ISN38_17080 [Xanthomonas translucens pv. undulosa]UKE44676.1 hypothetical protein KAF26_07105 [Xanthomonas translucens pv. secalis]WLA07337.1 hypothetical protein MO328_12970 [Xanthomonas translucens]WLA13597.1 hypothetical protein MO327_07130 [Xanthomonas translucens]